MQTIRIATRQSALALWQTNLVAAQLRFVYPEITIELVGLTTTGDKILHRPLAEVGGKALFVKELEQALLDNQADIAVHSLKDVPADLSEDFVLAAILEREDPRDAFLSVAYSDLMSLPKQARVGTSSFRRKAQLLALRPDLTIINLRGNVDTRLSKLLANEYDAIVLAYAGLKRLQMTTHIKQILPLEWMLPAAGQGAIAIECKKHHSELLALLQVLNHSPTARSVLAERKMVENLQGDCYSPIGCYAAIAENALHLHGLVANPDGSVILRSGLSGQVHQAQEVGQAVAADLLRQGAKNLLCQS